METIKRQMIISFSPTILLERKWFGPLTILQVKNKLPPSIFICRSGDLSSSQALSDVLKPSNTNFKRAQNLVSKGSAPLGPFSKVQHPKFIHKTYIAYMTIGSFKNLALIRYTEIIAPVLSTWVSTFELSWN